MITNADELVTPIQVAQNQIAFFRIEALRGERYSPTANTITDPNTRRLGAVLEHLVTTAVAEHERQHPGRPVYLPQALSDNGQDPFLAQLARATRIAAISNGMSVPAPTFALGDRVRIAQNPRHDLAADLERHIDIGAEGTIDRLLNHDGRYRVYLTTWYYSAWIYATDLEPA